MEHHKVIVIGLGTAGLSACKVLHDHGIDYIGIDSKKEIGKPIRSTGGIAMMFVDKYGMPKSDDVVAAYISKVRLTHQSGDSAMIGFDHPVAIVYRFTEYENAILQDKSKLHMNEKVLYFHREVNSARIQMIETDRGMYSTDYIIVATGPVSNITVTDPDYTLPDEDVLACYEETRYTAGGDADVVLHFDDKLAPGGYLWDFVDADGKRRIGLGAVKTHKIDLRKSLSTFTKLHPEVDGDVDHTIGHLIALAKPPRKVVFKNILMVGEAARTTFASDGAGLQLAYGSGMEAALAIVNNNAGQYQRVWSHELRPMLLRHYKLKLLLYSLTPKQMSGVIRALNSYTPQSTNAVKELPRAALYCMRNVPSLIPKLMKFLI